MMIHEMAENGSIREKYIVEGLEVINHKGDRGIVRNVRPGLHNVPTYAIEWINNGYDNKLVDGYYPASMSADYIGNDWILPLVVAQDLGWFPRPGSRLIASDGSVGIVTESHVYPDRYVFARPEGMPYIVDRPQGGYITATCWTRDGMIFRGAWADSPYGTKLTAEVEPKLDSKSRP